VFEHVRDTFAVYVGLFCPFSWIVGRDTQNKDTEIMNHEILVNSVMLCETLNEVYQVS
jgi:hypothetical protein